MSSQDNQLTLEPISEGTASTTVGEELLRIVANIESAYASLKEKGATISNPETTDYLSATIDSIPTADVVFDPDTGILTITTSKRVEGELC